MQYRFYWNQINKVFFWIEQILAREQLPEPLNMNHQVEPGLLQGLLALCPSLLKLDRQTWEQKVFHPPKRGRHEPDRVTILKTRFLLLYKHLNKRISHD